MTHNRSSQFCGRTRREFLWQAGAGFGGLALTGLLDRDGFFNRAAASGNGLMIESVMATHSSAEVISRTSDIGHAGCIASRASSMPRLSASSTIPMSTIAIPARSPRGTSGADGAPVTAMVPALARDRA